MDNVSYQINRCPNCGSVRSDVSTSGTASCCGKKVKPQGGLSQREWNQFVHGGADAEMEMRKRMRDPEALAALNRRGR